MYLKLSSGKKLSGDTWKELLTALRDDTYFDQSIGDYMTGVGLRIEVLYNQEISYQDEESFLRELERLGIIEIGSK